MIKYEILKKSKAFLLFCEQAKNNKLSHAYIVENAESEVANEFVKLMLAVIYCKNNLCLACEDCQRATNFYNHNIHKYPKKAKLDSEELLEILRESELCGVERGKNVFLLENFHFLNEKMQNKLLKVLEEPPKDVIFILTVDSLEKVLPTVCSRMTKLKIENFSKAEIAEELHRLYADNPRIGQVAILCGGNIGKADKLLTDNELLELYELILEVLRCYEREKFCEYSAKLAKFKDKLDEILDIVLLIFRDSLMRKSNLENLCLLKERFAVCDRMSLPKLIEMIAYISEMRLKINRNVNRQIIFDSFLVKLEC